MANPLITVAQIKNKSLINGNADAQKLGIMIDRSQDLYLREILGKPFFDYLLAATTYTTPEQTLIDEYIFKFLMVRTEIEACVHFNWDIRNKSVGASNDQYAQAGDWESIDKLKNDLNKQAYLYRNMLVVYLNDNLTSFPLYEQVCDALQEQTSFSQNITFSIARQ
jgi:hypothetical protein